MNYYMLVLRIVHILGGVLWAGATIVLSGFSETVVETETPAEQKLRRLVKYAGMSQFVGVSGILAGLSGILLYWRVSGGFSVDWMTTGTGLALTIGGIAGLLAAVTGGVMVGGTNNKILALNEQVQNGGGSLNAEQSGELQDLHERIRKGERWTALLLVIAVLGMSIAQYLFF